LKEGVQPVWESPTMMLGLSTCTGTDPERSVTRASASNFDCS
jgi:hypothetical protein